MEVKIVESPELGEVQPETLTLFGNVIGRSWTKASFSPAEEAKVRGNRFFAVKGEKKDPLDHDQNGAKGGAVVPEPDLSDLNSLTVVKLKELAAERGVDIDGLTRKGDIVAALELAQEAGAQA